MSAGQPKGTPIDLPRHWTPQQAMAVFEFLRAAQEAMWAAYGAQVQQAWRDELDAVGDWIEPPDPDTPF